MPRDDPERARLRKQRQRERQRLSSHVAARVTPTREFTKHRTDITGDVAVSHDFPLDVLRSWWEIDTRAGLELHRRRGITEGEAWAGWRVAVLRWHLYGRRAVNVGAQYDKMVSYLGLGQNLTDDEQKKLDEERKYEFDEAQRVLRSVPKRSQRVFEQLAVNLTATLVYDARGAVLANQTRLVHDLQIALAALAAHYDRKARRRMLMQTRVVFDAQPTPWEPRGLAWRFDTLPAGTE